MDDPVEALNGTFAIAGAADAYIILRRGGDKDQWIAHVDGRDWQAWATTNSPWEFVPAGGLAADREGSLPGNSGTSWLSPRQGKAATLHTHAAG